MGWLWYLGTLLPVIGLLQSGEQARADRFTYLPQIGLCIALAWGSGRPVPVLVASALGVWRRVGVGAGRSHGVRMASDVFLVAIARPFGPMPWLALRETLWLTITWCLLSQRGSVRGGDGTLSAGPADQAPLRLAPHKSWHRLSRSGPVRRGHHTLPKGPGNRPARRKGALQPGAILVDKGQFIDATAHYRQAIELNPNSAEPHNNLAWLLATCPEAMLRNGAEAIEHAQQASRLSGGGRPDMMDTLAAAYAEAGQFPEALVSARKALELAAQQNKPTLVDALRARIGLYEAGKPYRQPLYHPCPRRKNGE